MWLVPCARVRIISKKRLPRYYKKRGTIMIISNPERKECHVQLDSGDVVENVKQRYLQTDLPRRKGGAVIVVKPGELYGIRGRMLDFSSKTGVGAVQLLDDMIVHRLDQDDFAAYSMI